MTREEYDELKEENEQLSELVQRQKVRIKAMKARIKELEEAAELEDVAEMDSASTTWWAAEDPKQPVQLEKEHQKQSTKKQTNRPTANP